MTALSLSAVGCSWRQSGVALTADVLLTVVLGSQGFQRWFNHGVLVEKGEKRKEFSATDGGWNFPAQGVRGCSSTFFCFRDFFLSHV